MIFRRKRDSANYLMISTAHSIKSSLNILKKDDDLKKKVEVIHKHKINSHYENHFIRQKNDNNNSQKTQKKLYHKSFIKKYLFEEDISF